MCQRFQNSRCRAQETAVEIFRRVDAEQITESNREGAVTGRSQRTVECIPVHVRSGVHDAVGIRQRIEPVLLN